MDVKLQEVMAGCAQEYLEPLANLQENMQIRTKVAGGSSRISVWAWVWQTGQMAFFVLRLWGFVGGHKLDLRPAWCVSQGSTGGCVWSP